MMQYTQVTDFIALFYNVLKCCLEEIGGLHSILHVCARM